MTKCLFSHLVCELEVIKLSKRHSSIKKKEEKMMNTFFASGFRKIQWFNKFFACQNLRKSNNREKSELLSKHVINEWTIKYHMYITCCIRLRNDIQRFNNQNIYSKPEYVAFLSKFISTHNKIDEWNKHIINIFIIKGWCVCEHAHASLLFLNDDGWCKNKQIVLKIITVAQNPNSKEHQTMNIWWKKDHFGNEHK